MAAQETKHLSIDEYAAKRFGHCLSPTRKAFLEHLACVLSNEFEHEIRQNPLRFDADLLEYIFRDSTSD